MKNHPTLHIDPGSPKPAYRQIVDGLRALLVAGAFKPDDRLPPVRQLATDLAVHHNTVAEAYRRLAQEGWLELKRGRGARVCDRQKPLPDSEATDGFKKRLRELVAEAVSGGVELRWIAQQLRNRADALAETPPEGSR